MSGRGGIRRRWAAAWGVALLAVGFGAPIACADDLTAQVNPLSGTLGAGFPMVAAGVPFGMAGVGPDTAMSDGSQDPVNYDGYGYQDPTIRGFSLTHFDGAGVPIAGDLPFMPTTGAVDPSDALHNASPYDHATEVAHPGYYAVTLARSGIRTQLTGSARGAVMRFTFPATKQANVLAEVSQSINGAHPGSVDVVGDDGLEGWVKSDAGYRLYFAARFDRPFASTATWGDPALAALTFDTTANPTVTMRAAISYVDQAGAWNNLAGELPDGRSFDDVRATDAQAWDDRLHDAVVSGGDPALTRTFYTNLYRSLLMPSLFDDADGRYLGFDNQIHQVAAGHHHYSGLSLWDTYRSQTPLLELIEPGVAQDVMTSLIDDADQNHGVIPRWVQANSDRGIMGGDSGSATLADGIAQRVITGAEAQHGLSLLLAQANTLPPVWPREHLDDYVHLGYVPDDHSGIGAALTTEYAIDDEAVARAAAALGDTADAQQLQTRAGNWRNLMDPSSHFLRPRNSDGSWANPTRSIGPVPTPTAVPWTPDFQDGYQEGTGWQYLWAVPHDVAGLFSAMGGAGVAQERLDRFFSTPLNTPVVTAVPEAQQQASFFGIYYIGDQYTPANETDLWAPWYYDWLGQPWKTQRIVRAEMGTYNPRPDGLPGNDDTGEMSAWYVLAALGIYHAAPGVNAYELNSPAFPDIALRTPGGMLQIAAPDTSPESPYVSALALDGHPIDRTFLTHHDLVHGRSLAFSMSAVPTTWGTAPGDAPPSAG